MAPSARATKQKPSSEATAKTNFLIDAPLEDIRTVFETSAMLISPESARLALILTRHK